MKKMIFVFVCLIMSCTNTTDKEEEAKLNEETTEQASYTSMEEGVVIWDGSGCSYAIIQNSLWYILVDEYSGYLSNGDRVGRQSESFLMCNQTL